MYKDEKLLQYARENLAEFAIFIINNELHTKCKPPTKIGFYVKDLKGGLWSKNEDVFYYIPENKSLPTPYAYNYKQCYRMPYSYQKYDAAISYELLFNNYLTQANQKIILKIAQVEKVQSILDNFDQKTINVLKEYIEYGELPEITNFDPPEEVLPLIEADLICTDFDYLSEDSLAFWYKYYEEFHIAIHILQQNESTMIDSKSKK